MITSYPLLFLLYLLPFTISVEEYTTYHTNSKYPRPLLLSSNVLALSGNPAVLIKAKKFTKDYLSERKQPIKQYKRKLLTFYIVSVILFGFFWYYVSAFCAVHQQSQKPWLESSIISFIFCIIFQTFYSFLILLLRTIGLKCHISCFYSLSKYLL